MDFARQKELFNLCDPQEALDVGDERNIDLDRYETGSLRGRAWAETLAKDLLLSEQPLYRLLSGLPDSGKSTELRRLKARLEAEGFLVVLVDADERMDLTNTIAEPELLAAVVYELERGVLELEGKYPSDAAASEGYLRRLWNFLHKTDVVAKEVRLKPELTGAVPAHLVLELKTRPSFREEVRGLVRGHLTEFLAEVRRSILALRERARAQEKGDVVVIVDSLEKLRGMSDNWEPVMKSAERVFGHGDAKLPVHVLYTVPAALLSRLDGIEFMPALKVRDQDRKSSCAALELLSKLMLLRVPEENRADLFDSPGQAGSQDRASMTHERELGMLTAALALSERYQLIVVFGTADEVDGLVGLSVARAFGKEGDAVDLRWGEPEGDRERSGRAQVRVVRIPEGEQEARDLLQRLNVTRDTVAAGGNVTLVLSAPNGAERWVVGKGSLGAR